MWYPELWALWVAWLELAAKVMLAAWLAAMVGAVVAALRAAVARRLTQPLLRVMWE